MNQDVKELLIRLSEDGFEGVVVVGLHGDGTGAIAGLTIANSPLPREHIIYALESAKMKYMHDFTKGPSDGSK